MSVCAIVNALPSAAAAAAAAASYVTVATTAFGGVQKRGCH